MYEIKGKHEGRRGKWYARKRWSCLIKRKKSDLREQIKSCNECAVILAVLISLFVYFSSHLPRHAVPQCFPSSLVRSYCCALMHVLGWCSCPGRLCLFMCVAQCLCMCLYKLAHFFLLIKLLQWSDTSCVSADSSCFWPFCRKCTHTHTHITCTHVHMSWWLMVLLPEAFKGQKGA